MFSFLDEDQDDEDEAAPSGGTAETSTKSTGLIEMPKKACDYASGDDYDPADHQDVIQAPNVEKFKQGQHVVIRQRNDRDAYALCQVKGAPNEALAALQQSAKAGYGKITQYPPGMYALVAYVRTLPTVTHFINIRCYIR